MRALTTLILLVPLLTVSCGQADAPHKQESQKPILQF